MDTNTVSARTGYGEQEAASAYDLWDIPSYEESNKEFEILEENNYIFRLAEIGDPEPVAAKFDPSGKKTRAQFTFEVVSDLFADTTWAGTKINTWYTISMNEKSNLYPVAKALLGGKVEPNMRIKPSMIVGKLMQASVFHPAPNEKGQVWPQIKSPMALRNRPGTIQQAIEDTFDAEAEAPF